MEWKLFRIIIFLMIILNGYASDLVNIYRTQGLNSVEIEIEKTLKNQDYWKEYLKDKNVDYGYYEYKKYVLLTQKDQLEISLFEVVDNDFKLILRNSVITG